MTNQQINSVSINIVLESFSLLNLNEVIYFLVFLVYNNTSFPRRIEMKSIQTLLLILIILFVGSTMPLILSPIDYSATVEQNQAEEPVPVFTLSIQTHTIQQTTSFSMILESDLPVMIPIEKDYLFQLYVYNNYGDFVHSQLIGSTDSLSLDDNQLFISPDQSIEYAFPFSQNQWALPNGQYRFEIIALNDQFMGLSTTFSMDLNQGGHYIPASNTAPQGQVGVPYYLVTEDNHLVPVTKWMNGSQLTHRLILQAYQQDSSLEGLHPAVGGINYIISRDNVIYIDIPIDDPIYTSEDDQIAYNAYVAFVQPFFNLPNIVRVRFTLDNLVREHFFNNQYIRFAIDYEQPPAVFMPVLIGDRYFLTEKHLPIIEEETVDDTINRLIEHLNTVPWIDLESQIEPDTITISIHTQISSPFIEQGLFALIMDSLVYTIRSVDTARPIFLDTTQEVVLDIIDLTQPLQKNPYINVISQEITP